MIITSTTTSLRRGGLRALVRTVAVGGALLSAACSDLSTAPGAPAAASTARAATAASLAPSIERGAARRNGYMLSSGFAGGAGHSDGPAHSGTVLLRELY